MMLLRFVRIALIAALIGVLPVLAGSPQNPGGDGGVVILPNAFHINSDIDVFDPGSSGQVPLKTITLEQGHDRYRFVLPAGMEDAVGVIVVPNPAMALPLNIVAGQFELDLRQLQDFGDSGTERVELLVVSSNSLAIRVTLEFGAGNAKVVAH